MLGKVDYKDGYDVQINLPECLKSMTMVNLIIPSEILHKEAYSDDGNWQSPHFPVEREVIIWMNYLFDT